MPRTRQCVRNVEEDPLSNVCRCASPEIDTLMPVAAHLLSPSCKMHQNRNCSDNDERPEVHTTTNERCTPDILLLDRSEMRSMILDGHETLGFTIELALFLKSVGCMALLSRWSLPMGAQWPGLPCRPIIILNFFRRRRHHHLQTKTLCFKTVHDAR